MSLAGIKQSARVGASLLRGVGLHNRLLARTFGDYAAIARRAVRQRRWLRGVREELAAARMAAPLFDTLAWTRAMEKAVLMGWEVQVVGLPPYHVIVHEGVGGQARAAKGGKNKRKRKRKT